MDYDSDDYVNYLRNVLDPASIPYLCQAAMDALQSEITEEELYTVLKSMTNIKAPGSDGLTVNF